MFCSNCGSNVEEGIYCPNCGAQVEESDGVGSEETSLLEAMPVTEVKPTQDNTASKDNKKKKRVLTPEEQAQRKKTITKLIVAGSFFLFALLMVFIAICVGLLSLSNPAHKIIDALESGYYYSAVNTYEYDMGKPNKKLIEGLNERLDFIWENYQSNSYAYDESVDELEAIEEMKIEEISAKLEETITNVEALNNSREAFEDAQDEVYYEDYVEAIYYFGQVIATDPNYETAQSEIKRLLPIYKDEVFGSVDEHMADRNYYSAFMVLLEAKEALNNDGEITKKIEECETAIVSEADKLVGEKKYDEAIELIESAIEGYPQSEAFIQKLESIQTSRPVYLKDLTASVESKNYKYDDGSFTDAKGNEYDGNFVFDPGMEEEKLSKAEFYLEEKYSKFTATFTTIPSTNNKENFTIQILVDGKVVKTIKNFTIKSENQSVDIDVTGASKLEIRVKSTDWNSHNYISMVDACVYK